MRWLRYEHEGHGHVGLLQGDKIQPVAASSLFEVIEGKGTQPKGDAFPLANAKLNLEGKDYVVRDGDVIHFKFNV